VGFSCFSVVVCLRHYELFLDICIRLALSHNVLAYALITQVRLML
jgi:hypothetical protein